MNLSTARMGAARDFVERHGRELDRALAAVFFDDADPATCVAALGAFRNPDGGFGHGLEQDFLMPESSPMATSIALGLLAEIGADAGEPLVADALGYLTAQRDDDRGVWPFTSAAVDAAPHAPWWDYGSRSERDELALNPSTELVGYFVRWRDAAPGVPVDAWLEAAAADVLARREFEGHEILCAIRLTDTPGLPGALRERLTSHLAAALMTALGAGTVQSGAAGFSGYGIRPLTVAPARDSLLAANLRDSVDAHIEFELAEQGDDGGWRPPWSWFGAYPEDWARVEPEIAAFLTVKMLRSLQLWGRLAAD